MGDEKPCIGEFTSHQDSHCNGCEIALKCYGKFKERENKGLLPRILGGISEESEVRSCATGVCEL